MKKLNITKKDYKMKKIISTPNAPAATGLLSQAIEVDGWVYTAGQIHNNPEGVMLSGSMKDKTAQVMKNLQAILSAADCTFDNVIKATVYVTSMNTYREFNEVYPTYFKETLPAREVVCVKELPLRAELEISMIAKKP